MYAVQPIYYDYTLCTVNNEYGNVLESFRHLFRVTHKYVINMFDVNRGILHAL